MVKRRRNSPQQANGDRNDQQRGVKLKLEPVCLVSKDSKTNFSPCITLIPGIGPKMAERFNEVGIHTVSDFSGKDPDNVYKQLCFARSSKLDRCVLYVCRCAVYFATNTKYDDEKLKWWNWKDDILNAKPKEETRKYMLCKDKP